MIKFIRDNNELVIARASFGRRKNVTVNKYNGYVYVHLFGPNGKQISLGSDEFVKLNQQTESAKLGNITGSKRIEERGKLKLFDIYIFIYIFFYSFF